LKSVSRKKKKKKKQEEEEEEIYTGFAPVLKLSLVKGSN
jgi:hypothetical protein